jgi:dipeptidyl aminopeptidase/acylaminoacyl peptidase
MLVMGLRGLDSVMVEVDVAKKEARELWSTPDACGSTGFPSLCVLPGRSVAIVRHGWKLAPEIGVIDRDLKYHMMYSFYHPGSIWLRDQFGPSETFTWKSTDGTEIQGFLYLPSQGSAPYKTILNVHGGPFSAFSNSWMGYRPWVAFLVAHGYAVFNPNPRGSVGRGNDFAAGVKGDLGGADAQDLLSGIDHLVEKGVVDPTRLGVIGGSYGGYMTAWLTTMTNRFRAAIPISPVIDRTLQWQSSDVHQTILDDGPYRRDSLFETRSPLRHVDRVKTPTLQLVGAQDSCTPPAQAHYYHVALTQLGVRSLIVEYPLEGHGIRNFPALIDACVRMLSWFGAFVDKGETGLKWSGDRKGGSREE